MTNDHLYGTSGINRGSKYTGMLSHTVIIALSILAIGLISLLISALSGDEVFNHISPASIGLITSSLIAIMYEYALRRSFSEGLDKQLAIALDVQYKKLSESLDKRYEVLSSTRALGITNCLTRFTLGDFTNIAKHAKDIVIIQTWIPNGISIARMLEFSAQQGATIRIALIDPNSPAAISRDESLGYESGDVASRSIELNLMELSQVARNIQSKELAGSIEVRLYSNPPVASIYMCDTQAIVGSYWNHVAAIEGPQLLIDTNNGGYGEIINKHISSLWDTAKAIDLIAYEVR